MSTIKVDTIQKVNGSVPKPTDLGLNVSGHVIQTVINTATSTVTTSSSSSQALLSASITPQFTDSVIHIEGYIARMAITFGDSNAYASFYILDPSDTALTTGVLGSSGHSNSSSMSIQATHEPNSTSSQTYEIRLSTASGGTSSTTSDGQRYTIKLTEIRA